MEDFIFCAVASVGMIFVERKKSQRKNTEQTFYITVA